MAMFLERSCGSTTAASYSNVIGTMVSPRRTEAPSVLAVSVLEEPEPLLNPVLLSQVWPPPTKMGSSSSEFPAPLPNCSEESSPQHIKDPLSSVAHVKYSPVAMETAVRPEPRSIGVVGGVGSIVPMLLPNPNCPLLLSPQHFTEPSSRMAQVCQPPAEMATAVRPEPRSTGVVDGAVVVVVIEWDAPPSPNCPCQSDPQHFTEPSSRMAQE